MTNATLEHPVKIKAHIYTAPRAYISAAAELSSYLYAIWAYRSQIRIINDKITHK